MLQALKENENIHDFFEQVLLSIVTTLLCVNNNLLFVADLFNCLTSIYDRLILSKS